MDLGAIPVFSLKSDSLNAHKCNAAPSGGEIGAAFVSDNCQRVLEQIITVASLPLAAPVKLLIGERKTCLSWAAPRCERSHVCKHHARFQTDQFSQAKVSICI